MSKTIRLAITLLKTSFDLGFGNKSKKASKKKSSLIALSFLTLILLSLSLPIITLVNQFVLALNTFNLSEAIWYVVLPIASLSIGVLSLFSVISIMFLSNDNKILLFLPLSAKQIFSARFFVVLVYTYLILAIFIAPILIGYGTTLGLPLSFYLIGLINMILIPIIPLSLIVLVMSYLLRYTNLAKYRDAFTYLAMGIVLTLALAFNYYFTQAIGAIELNPAEIVENVRSLLTVYGNVINRFFPYLSFALNSLISNDILEQLLNLFILISINLTIIFVLIIFIGPVYLKTIIGSDERRKNRKVNNVLYKNKPKNIFISLISLEWKTLVRSPIYFLNLILIVIILPLILFGSIFFGTSASASQVELLEIIELMNGLDFNFNNPLYVSILFGISLFLGSTTLIAPTAISRLGGSAAFFKALPISNLNFINFKVFWANVLTIVPILIYIVIGSIYNFLGVFEAMLLAGAIIPLFTLINYFGFMIDLFYPKLDWLNEAQAVKQNLNTIFYMLGIWLLIALLVYGGFLIEDLGLPINGYIYTLIILGLSLAGNLAIVVYFVRSGYKIFKGVS
jgi:ABC-2 type transport system permease protein